MNTKETFKFGTEWEADAFIEKVLANKNPIDDVYISGPTFCEGNKIFKNMEWATDYDKVWWSVTVETYK